MLHDEFLEMSTERSERTQTMDWIAHSPVSGHFAESFFTPVVALITFLLSKIGTGIIKCILTPLIFDQPVVASLRVISVSDDGYRVLNFSAAVRLIVDSSPVVEEGIFNADESVDRTDAGYNVSAGRFGYQSRYFNRNCTKQPTSTKFHYPLLEFH